MPGQNYLYAHKMRLVEMKCSKPYGWTGIYLMSQYECLFLSNALLCFFQHAKIISNTSSRAWILQGKKTWQPVPVSLLNTLCSAYSELIRK